jgi:adenosylcobinamide-phosphate synthase
MNRSFLFPAVYFADQIAGDPEWFPHPVRVMGWSIAKGETLLRRPEQSDGSELLAGAALAAAVVTASYFMTRLLIERAYRHSNVLGWLTEIGLGWTCLAARNLQDEASAILKALDSGDIMLARNRLARIVGRDTQHLDIREVCRALIETVAESSSDGVIAPLFYMCFGGVPLAMAYKAINTLDSMIGHTNTRYFYFGKASARLDDAANYLPARITAVAIVAASLLCGEAAPARALNIWLRDGDKHKSPNAGQPESAMAGALGVRLGGGNTYDGVFLPAEQIGEEFQAPHPSDARNAIRMVSTVALMGLGAGMLFTALLKRGKAR